MKQSKNGPQITIKAKVTDDSKSKLQLLEDEHRRFQAYIHGVKDVNLYSATRQQADRFLDRVKKRGGRLNPILFRLNMATSTGSYHCHDVLPLCLALTLVAAHTTI